MSASDASGNVTNGCFPSWLSQLIGITEFALFQELIFETTQFRLFIKKVISDN